MLTVIKIKNNTLHDQVGFWAWEQIWNNTYPQDRDRFRGQLNRVYGPVTEQVSNQIRVHIKAEIHANSN